MAAFCAAVNLPNVGASSPTSTTATRTSPGVKEALAAMLPLLWFLNFNGMNADGDKKGPKIMVIGQGDLDVSLARTICESGYTGPIGILNHTGLDAETRLLDNQEGLEWVVGELTGAAVPKPVPRARCRAGTAGARGAPERPRHGRWEREPP